MTEDLSETQLNHLNATFLFEEHRLPIQNFYFPEEELVDLRTQPHIEFSCENPYLNLDLRRCLPFGHFLTTAQKTYLIGDRNKSQLLTHSRAQILYWYLARAEVGTLRRPVDHLAIYYETDQFWFNHIPANADAIIQRLYLNDHHCYFLQRFTLTHTFIQLEIGELRLITNEHSPEIISRRNLVHIPGTTYHRSWTSEPNSNWQITRNHQDPRTVNPAQPYFWPPTIPGDPDFHPTRDLQDPIHYYLPPLNTNQLITGSLQDSSLPSLTTKPHDWEVPPPDPGWSARNPYRHNRSCNCGTELCYCGYRPDTPQTPPNVTLWTPGDHHLPHRD